MCRSNSFKQLVDPSKAANMRGLTPVGVCWTSPTPSLAYRNEQTPSLASSNMNKLDGQEMKQLQLLAILHNAMGRIPKEKSDHHNISFCCSLVYSDTILQSIIETYYCFTCLSFLFTSAFFFTRHLMVALTPPSAAQCNAV